MKILGKQPSREKCAESGWFATDYLLDAPIDRAFILSLRPLGSFVFRSPKRISYCSLRVTGHGVNNNIIFKADCMQNPSLLYCAHEIITGGRV